MLAQPQNQHYHALVGSTPAAYQGSASKVCQPGSCRCGLPGVCICKPGPCACKCSRCKRDITDFSTKVR